MALLTNEQIEELIGIASNQSTSRDLHDEFHRWNEKQKGIQFYVDWNNAPLSASRAELTIAWYNNNKFLISENVLGFIPRPTTPHPHAEMIAKYAEVAQRRVDPWVEFEWFDEYDGKWKKYDWDIKFNSLNKFRYIGETK